MRSPDGPPVTHVCVGSWRLARAATVSLMALGVSVGGHAVVGGMLPPRATLAVVWSGSAVLSWALSGRRWGGRELAGVLILVQALVHLACAAAPHGVIADRGPTMLAGHIAATGMCVYVLSRAEAALWRLAETYLPRPLATLAVSPNVRRSARASTIRAWRDAWANMARLLITDSPLRAPPRPI